MPADVSINVWQPDFFQAADSMVASVPLADVEDLSSLAAC